MICKSWSVRNPGDLSGKRDNGAAQWFNVLFEIWSLTQLDFFLSSPEFNFSVQLRLLKKAT